MLLILCRIYILLFSDNFTLGFGFHLVVITVVIQPAARGGGNDAAFFHCAGSLVAGGAVLGAIIFAVSTVSSFDPVARGRK